MLPHFSSFCIQTLKRTNYTDVSNLLFWVSFETTPNRLELLLPFISGRYVFSTRSFTEAGDQFLAFFLLDLSEAFNIPELYFFIAFPGSHILGLSFHMLVFFFFSFTLLVISSLGLAHSIFHLSYQLLLSINHLYIHLFFKVYTPSTVKTSSFMTLISFLYLSVST